MSKYSFLLTGMLSIAFSTSIALAQYSTEGLMIRPHLSGVAWTLDDIDVEAESGGGFGVGIAYGFTEILSALVQLNGARIEPDLGDSYALAHFDVGIRAHLGAPERKLKFTGTVAYSGRAAEVDSPIGTIEVSGSGLSLGAGVLYFMTTRAALDFDFLYTFGNISEVQIGSISRDVDEAATSFRLNLGVLINL